MPQLLVVGGTMEKTLSRVPTNLAFEISGKKTLPGRFLRPVQVLVGPDGPSDRLHLDSVGLYNLLRN